MIVFYRRSRSEVFFKKGAVKNFAKFVRKHLCQRLFLNKVAGLRGRRHQTHTHTHTHAHTRKLFCVAKRKKRSKGKKSFKTETTTRLSPSSEFYCFSHSRASRIQKFFLPANNGGQPCFLVFHYPPPPLPPLRFEMHFAGPGLKLSTLSKKRDWHSCFLIF